MEGYHIKVAASLGKQLQQRGVLPYADHERNALQLLGDLQQAHDIGTLHSVPTLVIDGLDEAEAEARAIALELVQRLARYAQVLVASRAIDTKEGSLLVKLGPAELLDLSAPEWAEETREDLRSYVRKRLAAATDAGARMDAMAVAEHLLTLSRAEGEGAFLLEHRSG